jgi:hypothetical protein
MNDLSGLLWQNSDRWRGLLGFQVVEEEDDDDDDDVLNKTLNCVCIGRLVRHAAIVQSGDGIPPIGAGRVSFSSCDCHRSHNRYHPLRQGALGPHLELPPPERQEITTPQCEGAVLFHNSRWQKFFS